MDISFKCPNCGAKIIIHNGQKEVECGFCHNRFLTSEVSKNILNNTKKSDIEEAIRLRNNCDFEEAALLLEELLTTDINNPDIYFQLLLCEYGISYVLDNDLISEKPILNRLHRESIFSKSYYSKLEALVGNDKDIFSYYKSQLDYIESLRVDALNVSEKQEKYDVFICYKRSVKTEAGEFFTQDSETARKLYEKFTNKWNLKVFFAQETLNSVAAGSGYEPVIYSALMSAKIFVLVCASPSNPEYLIAPWVKSEWQRFKKRVETEIDNKLLLLPVFDNGFKPEQLPKTLASKKFGQFQGIKLDDEFDSICKQRFFKVLSGEKRNQFKNLLIESEVKALSVEQENISLGKFTSYQEQELSDIEQTQFEIALDQMSANTDKGFTKAKVMLDKITKINPNNYEANLAKLKCDFKIGFDASIVNASMFPKMDYKALSDDFVAALSVAGDFTSQLREAFLAMLQFNLENNFFEYIKLVNTDNDPYALVMSSFGTVEEMYFAAEMFMDPFFNAIDRWSKDKRFAKIKDEQLLELFNATFRKIYSNYGVSGASSLVILYNKFGSAVHKAGRGKLSKQCYLEALKIDEFNVTGLWTNFIFNLTGKIFIKDYQLANALKMKNFTPIDVDNLPKLEDNLTNLYYFIIKSIKGGYAIDFSIGSYFSLIKSACNYMLNIPSKRKLAKEILYLIATVLDSGKVSEPNKIKFLLSSGNRLLIEEEFLEAKKYYEQILSFDNSNSEARWGLVKVEANSPTNYSLLFYKKDITDLDSYRSLINDFVSNHKGEVNYYRNYYALLENIKNNFDKDKRRKSYNYFKFKEKELFDDPNPKDASLEEILEVFSSNRINSIDLTQLYKDKKEKEQQAKAKATKEKPSSSDVLSPQPMLKTYGKGVRILTNPYLLSFVLAAVIAVFKPYFGVGIALIFGIIYRIYGGGNAVRVPFASKGFKRHCAILYFICFAVLFAGAFACIYFTGKKSNVVSGNFFIQYYMYVASGLWLFYMLALKITGGMSPARGSPNPNDTMGNFTYKYMILDLLGHGLNMAILATGYYLAVNANSIFPSWSNQIAVIEIQVIAIVLGFALRLMLRKFRRRW